MVRVLRSCVDMGPFMSVPQPARQTQAQALRVYRCELDLSACRTDRIAPEHDVGSRPFSG